MQRRGAPLIRLFLCGFALALLGVFTLAPSVLAQPGTGEASIVFAGSIGQGGASSFHHSDSMLTKQVEIGLPDDGVALEDSLEIFRVDLQERTIGIGRAESGLKIISKAARNIRSNISPPLLV